MGVDPNATKALTFDVFGTAVDWRGPVMAAARELGATKGISADWAAFADGWRGGYLPAMNRVRSGELPWTNFDDLHLLILDEIAAGFGLGGLSETERRTLNGVWRRLEPWPDAVEGLQRLKRKYIVAALSNGNLAQLVALAKHACLPWDCILSADMAKHYKPDPEIYRTAAELLDLPPGEVMMIACHAYDLEAARAVGFKTGFVHRPLEFGAGGRTRSKPELDFDLVASDFLELADRLGA